MSINIDSLTHRGVALMLYAAVPHRGMLDQGFYAAEVEGLRAHPMVSSVTTTNDFADVRQTNADGIVSYFYSHSALVGAIGKARGIPVVATGGAEQLLRDQALSSSNYAARIAAFQACTLTVRRLLATSTSDFQRMRALAWFGRDRVQLSFHGVPTTEQISKEAFYAPRLPGTLITIAGLDTELNIKRKGVFEAIDLLAQLRRYEVQSSLTIMGRTTCRAIVEAYAAERNLADRVHFTGYVSDSKKIDLLRRSQFYVQLSEYEGFGVGALEALAQGCQVIHTNVGGLRDTIADYGVVLTRDAVAEFNPDMIPPYKITDWTRFQSHLARFGVKERADTILRALGFHCEASATGILHTSELRKSMDLV